MAKARRFRSRGRSGGSRPVDWVANEATYQMQLPPVVMPVNLPPDHYPLTGNASILAASTDPAVNAMQYQMPQNDQTVVRVRGELWTWISPASSWWSTLNGRAALKARICVLQQFGGIAFTAAQAVEVSMFTPWSGNRDWMWEKTFIWIAQSAWGDLTVDPSDYIQSVEIDIRVQRRMKPDELLVLELEYIGMDYAGDPAAFPDAFVDFELRTLVKSIT